jgi:hypothetical protein
MPSSTSPFSWFVMLMVATSAESDAWCELLLPMFGIFRFFLLLVFSNDS